MLMNFFFLKNNKIFAFWSKLRLTTVDVGPLYQFFYFYKFGTAFFIIFYVFFCLVYARTPTFIMINRFTFSFNILLELVLFVFIFTCLLYFYSAIKNFKGPAYLLKDLRKVFTNNVLSLFVSYALILYLNYLVYSSAWSYKQIFYVLYATGANLNSQDYALLLIKAFYLLLGSVVIHSCSSYYINARIGFQYFSLVSLAVWGGLFVMNFDNFFYILLLMDAISLLTVAVVGLSTAPGFTAALSFSLHYYFYSIFTSLLGYVGCFLIYSCAKTLNANAIIFLSADRSVEFVFENFAFTVGGIFLLIKFFFLFSIYPYQQVILEVSSRLCYAYLLHFLVVLKLPVIVVFLKLLKVLWIEFAGFKYVIFVAGLSAVFYSALYIATARNIKSFLALSSINQTGFILILFYFNDLTSVYLALLFFVTYAASSAGLYLFLSSCKTYKANISTDGDMLNWAELHRFILDSYILNRMRSQFSDGAVFEKPFYFYLGVLCSAISLITIAGFPFLAGFFLKLSFIEIFLASKYFFSLALVIFTTLISMYAYFNMLILMKAEFSLAKNNKIAYDIKVSTASKSDAYIFFFVTIFILFLTLLSLDMSWFWYFINLTLPFFTDVNFYVLELNGGLSYDDSTYLPSFFLYFFSQDAYNRIWTGKIGRCFKKMQFIGGSYSIEFFWVTAFFTFMLIWVTLNALKTGDSTALFNFVWWRYLHIILVNFLCWYLFYTVFYSVGLYRLMFFIYIFIDLVAPFKVMQFWLVQVYYTFIVDLFWVSVADLPVEEFYPFLNGIWVGFYYFVVGGLTSSVFVALVAGAVNCYSGTIGKMSKERTYDVNAEFLRMWVRASFYALIDFIWKYSYILFSFILIFLFFGPCELASNTINHDYIFFFSSIYIFIKIVTVNFYIFNFIIWWALFTYLYCWFKDLNSLQDFCEYYNSMALPARAWFIQPSKFGQFLVYWFIAFLLPISLATDTPFTAIYFTLYITFIYWIQVTIYYFWHIAPIALISFGVMRKEAGELLFLKLIYAISLSTALFFINLAIAYRLDESALPTSSVNDSTQAFFVNLDFSTFDYFSITEVVYEIFPKFSIAWGYDYFTLILCIMTSLVFSFVYLISLYNPLLEDKKLYFFLFLMIQGLTLMSFLSTNILAFVIFFESSLLPMALIIGFWGSSLKKWFAAKQFLFYSLICSTPALVGIVYLYSLFGGRLDYTFVWNNINLLAYSDKVFLWIVFFLMFAVKIPIFPFHSWLLSAHVEAPAGGSIVLAAIMLKLGAFGFIRYLLGLFYDICLEYSLLVCSFAAVSIFYSSVSSITETDAKRLIAQTSIAHMGLVVLGLFMFSEAGFFGALYLIVGHGITSTALFYLVGILYDRFHTRELRVFGGLVTIMPLFCTSLFFFTAANSGFPWSLSFLGEFYILLSAVRELSLIVYVFIIVSAVALLYANMRFFIHVSFGTLNKLLISNATSDLTHLELGCLTYLAAAAVLIMLGNDYYFHPVFFDLLWRCIY